MDRTPEYLFIKAPEKSSIELVEQQIKGALPSLKRKLLQLLAKRLLVDSTRVHQVVFQQTYSESQQFFDECKTLPGKDQSIDFEGALKFEARDGDRRRSLKTSRYNLCMTSSSYEPSSSAREEKKLQMEQFETERKLTQGSIKKLQESNQKLTLRLEKMRRQHEDESLRRKAEVDTLKNQNEELQKSKAALGEQLNTRNKELDNEHQRREKFENALKTLQEGALSRYVLKLYGIQPK